MSVRGSNDDFSVTAQRKKLPPAAGYLEIMGFESYPASPRGICSDEFQRPTLERTMKGKGLRDFPEDFCVDRRVLPTVGATARAFFESAHRIPTRIVIAYDDAMCDADEALEKMKRMTPRTYLSLSSIRKGSFSTFLFFLLTTPLFRFVERRRERTVDFV